MKDPMDIYWQAIRHFEPLDQAEEIALLKSAQAGDTEAMHQLVKANLRFVVKIAREYAGRKVSFLELVSEGNWGLLQAIYRFDESYGVKFITYAVWWIRLAMRRAWVEHGMISLPPLSWLNDLQKVEKAGDRLAQELGRTPTFDEVVERIDINPERVHNAVEVGQQAISMDAPAYLDNDTPLHTVLTTGQESADEGLEKAQLRQTLNNCLDALDEREHQILREYFGLGDIRSRTLEEIGRARGLTRERIRQLRNQALKKIRTKYGDRLAEFV